LTFRVADPDGRYAAVRLRSDLHADPDFQLEGDEWVLTVDAPVARLEYRLEVELPDGTTDTVLDPANPHRAPGAFGEKSVMLAESYEPPAWLEAEAVEGEVEDLAIRARGLGTSVHAQIWNAGADGPLLVAHDGPELDRLAGLTRYSGAMIAAGQLPPHRVALLSPGPRDEWYSGSARYASALAADVLPALNPVDPVGMGASLGGLAMLHAHVRTPFAGLFLQSGSFFVLRHDAHEHRHPRFGRIIRVTRELRRDAGIPEPVLLTCGMAEENLANNRLMARALAAQEFDAELVEVPDMHNYTAWRDALHPHLTGLLARVWG
jgi:enterochelin esterase-like enzyme